MVKEEMIQWSILKIFDDEFPTAPNHSTLPLTLPQYDFEHKVERPICDVIVIGAGLCGPGSSYLNRLEKAIESQSLKAHLSSTRLELGSRSLQTGSGFFEDGVLSRNLTSEAAAPESLCIIRFDEQPERTGPQKRLQRRDTNQVGEPIWCLHRTHLQKALETRAGNLGVRLVFNSPVHDMDFDRTTIVCENGRIERGDLIIAADSLWSSTRSSFSGKPVLPQPTCDLAYWNVLTADQVKGDKELWDVVTRPAIRIWLGP